MALVQSPHRSRCTFSELLQLCRVCTSPIFAIKVTKKLRILNTSCTAGVCSGTTKVSQDFATRVAWFASKAKKWNCQPNSSGDCAPDQPPEPFLCSLAVSGCQIETYVEIMAIPEPSEPKAALDWHIHIGEADFEALESSGWDSQICYLHAVPQQGLPSEPPECQAGCASFTDALFSGHADCMRYWHGGPVALLANNISAGDDEAVRLYMQLHPSCKEAARWPLAEALMYLHDILGLHWDARTCAAAAEAGSDACLSYALCSGCPWHKNVCSNAAAAGSLACLVRAHEHGCPWDWATCAAAARRGYLDCLVYAHTHGCQWDDATCEEAAAGGRLEVLAYAHENGCPWNASTCAAAAYSGSIKCLVYAREHGCSFGQDGNVCACAAEGNSLQCLRYAHEQGCDWDQVTLFHAARVGSLDCLMYAHQHGCPYDPDPDLRRCAYGLTVAAVKGDHLSLPCLKYIHKNMGCTWHPDPMGWEARFALWEGRLDVLEYIYLHGGVRCGGDDLIIQKDELNRPCTTVDPEGLSDEKARCLLYMYCWGDCKLPQLRGTKVGEQVLALLRERRAAVLLSFRAAGRARAGDRSVDAAHAAMDMVPLDLIKDIMCLAKLLIAD